MKKTGIRCLFFTAESVLRFGLAFVAITGAYLLAQEAINTITYFIFLAAAQVVYDPVSAGFKQLSLLFETLVRII
ncbi:MAG: hypothetical protein LBR98_00870 [Syntrophomonadaceae bacterium]|jgi:hypothetical protein|nr:hypothetical protein [Syntrophomonadaceae bacterium]